MVRWGEQCLGTISLAQPWFEVAETIVQDDDPKKAKLNLSGSMDDDDEPISRLTPSEHLSDDDDDDDDAPLRRFVPIVPVKKWIANAMQLEK